MKVHRASLSREIFFIKPYVFLIFFYWRLTLMQAYSVVSTSCYNVFVHILWETGFKYIYVWPNIFLQESSSFHHFLLSFSLLSLLIVVKTHLRKSEPVSHNIVTQRQSDNIRHIMLQCYNVSLVPDTSYQPRLLFWINQIHARKGSRISHWYTFKCLIFVLGKRKFVYFPFHHNLV